jgi:hypothetical protein
VTTTWLRSPLHPRSVSPVLDHRNAMSWTTGNVWTYTTTAIPRGRLRVQA